MAKKGTLTVRVVGDAKSFNQTMGKVSGKLGGFAKQAATAGAAAAAAFGVTAVRAFGNFDQAMNESVAIMGNVSDQMRGDMSDAAREVAKATKFSAEEAAQSYFFLASAGLDAAESIEALPKVAQFAQAGNFDMALATDLLTDAQSALGLTVDDSAQSLENMARVGDVLVKANTLANASVEQFSEALTEKAGAALRNLGKDVEEGAAVLAVFADQGVKGSAAGTALNSVLEGLTRTAREQSSAYEDLGVDVFDAQGEMRNMGDIVGDLEGAFEGMSTEQRDAAIAQLGLTRTARDGIVALLGSADAIGEYEEGLRSAGGTAEDVATKQLDTFNAQIGLLKDQFMDFAISAGQVIVPKLLDALDFVRGWWDENGPAIIAAVKGVADAVTQWWTGTAQPAIRDFADAVGRMWNDDVKPWLEALQTAWRDNEDTIDEVVDNVGRILSAFGGIVADVLGLASDEVTDSTDTMDSQFGTLANTLVGLTEALASFLEMIDRIGDYRDLISEVGKLVSGRGDLGGLVSSIGEVVKGGGSSSPAPSSGSSSSARPATGSFQLGRFHTGGVVPGPRGKEVPILAQAGERVLTEDQQAGIGQTINLTINSRDASIADDVVAGLRSWRLAYG